MSIMIPQGQLLSSVFICCCAIFSFSINLLGKSNDKSKYIS